MLQQHLTLNCGGKLLSLDPPIVMGILNLTPDSFFDGGQYESKNDILAKAEKMLSEGADILDLGAMSSRPGADEISEQEELDRLLPAIEAILKKFPDSTISVDTYRSQVARQAITAGATMINDISGGQLDDQMFETVGELGVPYVLMHMKGTPQNMQKNPVYEDVALEVLDFFIEKTQQLRSYGAKDIILDPGFGFGKTIDHNYELLRKLHVFKILDWPILAGISRKSMIYKFLETTPQKALNGTSVLHYEALQQGAKILRVHDVKEAKETVKLWGKLNGTFESGI